MPKAPRASQSQGTYRAAPLVPQNLSSQNDRYRLRQLQAQNIAQQQVQRQQARAAQQQAQQQQQQLLYPSLDGIDNMQSYTRTNGGSHLSYASHSMAPMPSLYMSQPMSHQSLPQPMLQQPLTNNPAPLPTQVSSRASSGAWAPAEDSQLMTARAAGQNWSQIQLAHFPSKTANACRKRHERLMERRNSDDWDALKLEALGSNYMAMRKEIWGPLAEKCGEKWTNIEAKVLASGLKNLQSAARAAQRRARLSSGGSTHSLDGAMEAHGSSSYTDDSALGEDVDEFGGSPDTEYEYEEQSGYAPQQQHHQRQQSQQMQYQASQAPQMMGGMGGQYLDRNGYAAGGMSMPQLMRHASHSHTNSLGSNMSNGGRDMGIQNIINRGV